MWTVKNEAGYKQEKMWSGPEPRDCVSDVSEQTIPGTFDAGCYNYADNTNIFKVIVALSTGRMKQVRGVQ